MLAAATCRLARCVRPRLAVAVRRGFRSSPSLFHGDFEWEDPKTPEEVVQKTRSNHRGIASRERALATTTRGPEPRRRIPLRSQRRWSVRLPRREKRAQVPCPRLLSRWKRKQKQRLPPLRRWIASLPLGSCLGRRVKGVWRRRAWRRLGRRWDLQTKVNLPGWGLEMALFAKADGPCCGSECRCQYILFQLDPRKSKHVKVVTKHNDGINFDMSSCRLVHFDIGE